MSERRTKMIESFVYVCIRKHGITLIQQSINFQLKRSYVMFPINSKNADIRSIHRFPYYKPYKSYVK